MVGMISNSIGDRFGRWVIVGECFSKTYPSGQSQKFHPCECDCGTKRNVMASTLVRGKSESCGCIAKEKHTRHGCWGSGAHSSWHAMKQRCLNPNSSSYSRYGGAGVTICDKWLSFEGFYEDMGDRPEGATLDRIDGSKGYSKDNCRWASVSLQNHNRKATSESGFKGVYPAPEGWYARIALDGKLITIGNYPTKQEAAKAYNQAAYEIYGDDHSPNKI